MAQVTILQRTLLSKLVLWRGVRQKRFTHYLLCADSSGFIPQLESQGLKNYKHTVKEKTDPEAFLKAYIDCVGQINCRHNDVLWWATDFSSKNRFNCQLPFDLTQFLDIVNAFKEERYHHLVVIDCPWVILPSLKKSLRALKVPCSSFEDPFARYVIAIGAYARKVVSLTLHACRMIARILWVRVFAAATICKRFDKTTAYYVVKTFLYDSSFSPEGKYTDAFFGPLIDHLKERKNVLIFANILGRFKKALEAIKKSSQLIVPYEYFLKIFDVVRDTLRIMFYKPTIEGDVYFFGHEVSAIVKNNLLKASFKIQPYQLMHYSAVKRLASALKAETFLMTYENNPWEKMCMLALRHRSPQTKVIGYQHTVVPQAATNVFVSSFEANVPGPQRILTVGDEPKRILEHYGHYSKGTIEAASGLRFEYLSKLKALARKKEGKILLALEGIFDAYKVVNYALREIEGESEYQLTIRTHPVLPLGAFRQKLQFNLRNMPNVSISKDNLKQDLENADIVLYWGSTVAMEALCLGRPVIHYDIGTILSYDPLFACKHLKWVVSEKDSLLETVAKIHLLSDSEFDRESKAAKAYLDTYFRPNTPERLERFII